MALNSGIRLGSHEIVARVGAGIRGEVYKGRDPKLGRDVAINLVLNWFEELERLTPTEN